MQTNTLVGSYTQLFGKNEDLIKDAVLKQTVPFEISSRLLIVGQFYKVQLAFIDKTETIGYYSSTAVTKYTTKPLIYLSGLDYTLTNNHNYTYTGIYSQGNGDPTEKMYSCRFVMKDSNGKIFADSGDIIHHTYNDTSARESHEEYSIPNDLEQNKSYYMTFSVKTNNGMVVESHRYRIIKAGEVSPDMDVTLYTKRDMESSFYQPYREAAEYLINQPDANSPDTLVLISSTYSIGWDYYLTHNGKFEPIKYQKTFQGDFDRENIKKYKKIYLLDIHILLNDADRMALEENFHQIYKDEKSTVTTYIRN